MSHFIGFDPHKLGANFALTVPLELAALNDPVRNCFDWRTCSFSFRAHSSGHVALQRVHGNAHSTSSAEPRHTGTCGPTNFAGYQCLQIWTYQNCFGIAKLSKIIESLSKIKCAFNMGISGCRFGPRKSCTKHVLQKEHFPDRMC